ncbi:MAG: hypothetical protein ACT4O4_08005 [Nitrospiraceae bacterium]
MTCSVVCRRLGITVMIVGAVAVAYEAAWLLTGQYGEVGGLLYLASCLLGGILIPLRFILVAKTTPMRRTLGVAGYFIGLWGIWTMAWGGLALQYLDEHELERWQTTLLFYASTIGLPFLTALLPRTGHGPWWSIKGSN